MQWGMKEGEMGARLRGGGSREMVRGQEGEAEG